MIVLVPRVWMDPSTFEFSPLITAPITMIVVTPIMMPRTVRNDRSVLRRNTSNASPIASFSSPNLPVFRIASASPGYSDRNATTGSSRAAFVAG